MALSEAGAAAVEDQRVENPQQSAEVVQLDESRDVTSMSDTELNALLQRKFPNEADRIWGNFNRRQVEALLMPMDQLRKRVREKNDTTIDNNKIGWTRDEIVGDVSLVVGGFGGGEYPNNSSDQVSPGAFEYEQEFFGDGSPISN